ncbi:unnamed protein product [Closterium sp. NIES-53]
MASLRVLGFDHEGRPIQFDTWLDNLQLYLLSDPMDSVSLFDLASGAATAPPATADCATRSQWLTRDTAARLAICNHMPLAECAHFGHHRTAQALYNALVARYSSPATAALGRLLLPYLFPELSAFATVEDLVSHLRASDARYCATGPLSLTLDLLEEHLLAAETSAVDVGAACGTPRTPFFEGCSPSPLAPSYASAAAADVLGAEDVGATSASAKQRSSKGKGGRGGGGGSGSGVGGNGGGSGGSEGGGGGGTSAWGGGSGGGGGGSGGSGGSGVVGIGGGRTGARHGDVLRSGVAIFDLDFDVILPSMYALSVSAEQDCYRCVPRDPDIAAAALGASEPCTLPSTARAEALHTFTLDAGASRCFFRDSTTLTPLFAPALVRLADLSRGPVVARSSTVLPCLARVSICTCTRTGRHLATFTRRPGSSLYTLATEPPQTLLWHHRLGHPSLPRLRGMHSRLLVFGLPMSLPPLPPSPTPPCLPCIEGQQHVALHSSSFPPTTAPLQTLHMDVSRTSMIHAAAPHFLWPFAVRYAAHQLHLWPCSRAFVRDTSADKLSARAIPYVFLGFVPDAPGWQFYPPASRHVLPSQDVSFDESVPFERLFPYRSAPLPPPPLFLPRGPPLVDPLPPQGLAPLGVSQVDPPLGAMLGEVAVDLGAARGTASRGAEPGGPEPGGAEPKGAEPGGAETGGAEPGGTENGGAETRGAEPRSAEPKGVEPREVEEIEVRLPHARLVRRGGPSAEPGGTETGGAEPGGAELEGAESGGAEPQGAAWSGDSAGASPRLSPHQLREWLVRRARLRSGARGAGDAGSAGAGGAGVTAGAGVPGGTAATCLGGACTRAGGSGAVGAGAGGAGVGGTGAGGAGAGGAGAFDPGGTVRPRPYFVPLLRQTIGLTERRVPASRRASPVRTALRVPRPRPPPVPGTHTKTLRPSSVPLRVPLPAPPESSLPEVPDPEYDRARASSPTISRRLSTAVTNPSFESVDASALVAELLDFAAACRLDYATTLAAESASASPLSIGGECALGTDVLEDTQEDFQCLAAAVPRFTSMLLAPEGDPDAPDIPTPRSYAEAIAGPYSSQWVKRPLGSSPAFKARYVARGFSQQQGVDYFQTFSPTPKMTTLWVLLHVAAQHDYELQSLDFGTAFLQGSLHEEIWQCRPPGFTGTPLAAFGFAPSTADPSLFLRIDTSLPLFYVLVYVNDLVFATADTKALTLILQRFGFKFSSPQPTHLPTSHSLSAPPSDESIEPSGLYPELVGCLMYQMTWTQPDLAYPLSLLACYVALVSRVGLVLGGRGPVVLTGHADTSWVDDLATQWSSQGYTFSLGSGSVSWRSTSSSSVLSSSYEAKIYVGAMATQELHWLTYLLTDLAEQPRSPPQRGQLRLAYVAIRANTADIFTKALPPGDHQRFSIVLGLPPAPPPSPPSPCCGCSSGGEGMGVAGVSELLPPPLVHQYSVAREPVAPVAHELVAPAACLAVEPVTPVARVAVAPFASVPVAPVACVPAASVATHHLLSSHGPSSSSLALSFLC